MKVLNNSWPWGSVNLQPTLDYFFKEFCKKLTRIYEKYVKIQIFITVVSKVIPNFEIIFIFIFDLYLQGSWLKLFWQGFASEPNTLFYALTNNGAPTVVPSTQEGAKVQVQPKTQCHRHGHGRGKGMWKGLHHSNSKIALRQRINYKQRRFR